jgi:hypothetical protein
MQQLEVACGDAMLDLKAGWFPSLYVEQRQRITARKVADASPGV